MRAVDHVIEAFPQQMEAVLRLYLKDERFRSVCEDFSLAVESLHRFQSRPDADLRPEVDDYREVLRDLAAEIHNYLDSTWER